MGNEGRERSNSYHYNAEYTTGFEPAFNHYVNGPLLKLFVGPEVHPNSITLLSAAVIATFFIVSIIVPMVGELTALLLRCLLALLVVGYAILDCMDGLHARNTGQCSKYGEVMDHFVDSLGVPLNGAVFFIALDGDHFNFCCCMIGGVFTYLAQLVLYNHDDTFVSPPNGGAVGQLICAATIIVGGFGVYFFGRNWWIIALAMLIMEFVSTFGCLHNIIFFLRRLGASKQRQQPFWNTALPVMAICFVFWSQHHDFQFWGGNKSLTVLPAPVEQWLSPMAFTVIITGISMRICGGFVLRCALKRSWSGYANTVVFSAVFLVVQHFAVRYFALASSDSGFFTRWWLTASPVLAGAVLIWQAVSEFGEYGVLIKATKRVK